MTGHEGKSDFDVFYVLGCLLMFLFENIKQKCKGEWFTKQNLSFAVVRIMAYIILNSYELLLRIDEV
jgi:hypothetical protein